MSDLISTFFEAWEVTDTEARMEKLNCSVTKNIHYNDPRTTDTIKGIEALNDYVGMFSENAPGWSARVTKSDTTGDITRATVAFSGKGPDGAEKVQLGQYFIEIDSGLISRMVGFVGTGE